MSETGLVSIVVPAYNHEKYVRQTLDSALNSGLASVELIICDDASSDGTSGIIQQWIDHHQGQFSRVVFIRHQKNVGMPASMNEIIPLVRGEIVHCMASDDYYLPGGLLAKTRAMEVHPEWVGAFCDGQAVGMENELYQASLMAASPMNPARLTREGMAEELFFNRHMPANILSWRRSAFKAHGGGFEFDPHVFCEDLDFAWWALSQQSLGYVSEICFGYRCRAWPQTASRNPVVEHRDVGLVFAKYAQNFPGRMGELMRNRAAGCFFTAAGDAEAARPYLERDHAAFLHYRDPSPTVAAEAEQAPPAPAALPGPVVPAAESVSREVQAMRQELKKEKESGEAARIQNKRLKNQLRYHSSNPLRALKLWWKRKKTGL